MTEQAFIRNEETQSFFDTLKDKFSSCLEFKICVSFIRVSGVQLLVDILKELNKRNIKGKILTSTYMNVTQPDALEMLNSFDNIHLRIYTPKSDDGFHAKGYLFYSYHNQEEKWTIIIGSSNISGAAFKKNVEWNVLNNEGLQKNKEPGSFSKTILDEFDKLWESPHSKDFSNDFLISYRDYLSKIKKVQKSNKEIFSFEEEVISPNEMQLEAISKLNKLRKMNETKALAVAATGTGKTYMSVFDAMQVNPRRALFVVHRGDILIKAKESFDRILSKTLKDYSSVQYDGKSEHKNYKYLFVTETMLAKHLLDFQPEEFDYIVIDEAHHAADNSYTKIIDYFKPKFLLGLTATPERTDGKDIFSIFDFNRAVNIRLRESLEKDLVCPFHYFGIKEVDGIDYTVLKHSPEDGEEYLNEVTSLLMNSNRVDYILDKIHFYRHDGDKTKSLGFCATVRHAEFMADEFNRILGTGTAIALSGSNSVNERKQYLEELGADDTKLKYIFTRDIFNEGIDIQDVNLVLMLRPTQSSIVFTQQLGRGLRKVKGKEFLTVLDFIGNYQKSFLVTSVFSKEANPDKKTRLREVSTDFKDIPGDTFIHFDEIVKEQILRQIDSEKFMSDLNQKKAYFLFRKDNGNKIPMLTDYIKKCSDLDPCLFSKIKKGKILYHSYFEFVTSAENELKSEESINLNILSQNKIFVSLLSFLDTLMPAKRIEEWCILSLLFKSPEKEFTVSELIEHIKKYVDYQNKENIIHACCLLSGEFWDSNEIENYDKIRFRLSKNVISLHENVKELFKDAKSSSQIKYWLFDFVEYVILRYDDEFGREDYGFPFLKPYQKYSMRSLASLSNYEKIHSSFRGSGVLYNIPTDYFIFVDLYKEKLKKVEFNYDDRFISSRCFHWTGPDNWNQDYKIMQNIINHSKNRIKIHFFIRKFKEVEKIPQDYIYIGDGIIFKETVTVPKGVKSPVSMDFAIHEIPATLYEDFLTKVDVTNME